MAEDKCKPVQWVVVQPKLLGLPMPCRGLCYPTRSAAEQMLRMCGFKHSGSNLWVGDGYQVRMLALQTSGRDAILREWMNPSRLRSMGADAA